MNYGSEAFNGCDDESAFKKYDFVKLRRDAEQHTDETRGGWSAALEEDRQVRSVFVVTGKTPDDNYYCASLDCRGDLNVNLMQDRWLKNVARRSDITEVDEVALVEAKKKEEEFKAKDARDTKKLAEALEKKMEDDKHEKAAQAALQEMLDADIDAVVRPKKRKRTSDRLSELEQRLERIEYELGLD